MCMKRSGYKKSSTIVSLSVVILALLALLVLAELGTNSAVKIISPGSGSNFTNLSLGQTFLNVTFMNGTGITGWGSAAASFNVTFLMNNSGNVTSKWFPVANGTGICVRIGNGPDFSCAVNSSNVNFTLADGTYSLTANITNATNGILANLTNSSRTIKIDRTPPIATTSNFSSPFSSEVNLSSESFGNLFTINLSIADAVLGTQTVLVNITNRSSGVSNATLTLTREGSTDNFVGTINTSHYKDGAYNITVLANDSLNNLNNTAVLQRVVFDNTDPLPTASCSPSTVATGDAFPCSCSGTDVIAGVNSTSAGSTSPDGTIVPVNTGTFTYTCTVTDRAGNIASSGVTYTVESVASSAGGSAGGSGSGSSSSGSSGSSGTTSPTANATTGNGATGTGSGATQGAQQPGAPQTSSEGTGMGWIIAIIVTIVLVVIIVVMMKKRQ